MKRRSINDIIIGEIAHLSVCYHSVYHELLYNKIWHFIFSLLSRHLEVVGARKNGRERETHFSPRVSPSRAPVLFCAHYFQAPATQAIFYLKSVVCRL